MGQSHAKNDDITPEEFDQILRTSSLSSQEVHELQKKFQKEFPKGYIDKKGFKHLYATMYPKGSGADKFADHIFRIYDADGNGQISFREFIATLSVSSKGSTEEKLRATFRMYDIDRNGSITQKELTEILSAIFKSQNEQTAAAKAKHEAEKIMQQLDTDHNKKLSEDEFVHAAKSNPSISKLLQST